MTGTPIPSAPALERKGWDKRVQVTWIAPAAPIPDADDTPNVVLLPPPRSNLVLSTTRASQDTASAALEEFLRTTRDQIPNVTVVEQDRVPTFGDGVTGAEVVIEFWVTPDVVLRQVHLFRVDDGVVTQIVATVDASDSAEAQLEEELRKAGLDLVPARLRSD